MILWSLLPHQTSHSGVQFSVDASIKRPWDDAYDGSRADTSARKAPHKATDS